MCFRDNNLFTLTACLKASTPKEDYERLKKRLRVLFRKYDQCFYSINFSKIFDAMGFPENWEDLI